MKSLLYYIVLCLFIAGCGYYQKPVNHASPMVKVLLFEGSSFTVRPYKNYVLSINSRKDMNEGTLFVSLSNKTLDLNGMAVDADRVEIYPNQYFEFKGRKYRGSASIIKMADGLQLINTVDLESYLYGVLPNEVSPNWSMETLKAQAVVSRTFALYELANSRKKNNPYDLFDDTRSQVYCGIDKESKFTSLAVDSTMGEVIRYQGRIIQAFFHSASGGMTESSLDVFGDDKPYLTPVSSPYSGIYKENKWETSLSLIKLEELLHISNITSILVGERTSSKRIKTVIVSDNSTNKITLPGKELRNLLGPGIMKSTRANIRLTNDNLLISGMGYGHGVGMGQWDALGMAKAGYEYKSIVCYFYPGTRVDKIW
jgi:stage II sporulation protein D